MRIVNTDITMHPSTAPAASARVVNTSEALVVPRAARWPARCRPV